jgi:Flp pilus assembly protein TadG
LNIDPSWRKRIMTIQQMQLHFVSRIARWANITGLAPSGPAGTVRVRLYNRCCLPPPFRFARYPRCLANGRATAALEFAVATPLLVVMLGGAADYGLAQFDRAMLANAVAAGAQYATLTGSSDTASITSVIRMTSNLPNAASSVAVSFPNPCGTGSGPHWCCVTGSGPSTSAASQGGTCSDGSSAGYYISFNASYTNTGLMNGFMSAASQSMSEQVVARLQ